MTRDAVDLSPGSRFPRDARERDLLLRRVPEVAFAPELAELCFDSEALSRCREPSTEARIGVLADAVYLERLRDALGRLVRRAEADENGGLTFVAASLLHFVKSLPPARHPLVVALYFISLFRTNPDAEGLDVLSRQMDDYESGLDDEG